MQITDLGAQVILQLGRILTHTQNGNLIQQGCSCTKGNPIIPHINTNSRGLLNEHSEPLFFPKSLIKPHQTQLSVSNASTLSWNPVCAHPDSDIHSINSESDTTTAYIHQSTKPWRRCMVWREEVCTPSPGPSHTEFRAAQKKMDPHTQTVSLCSLHSWVAHSHPSLPCFSIRLVYHTMLLLIQLAPHVPAH